MPRGLFGYHKRMKALSRLAGSSLLFLGVLFIAFYGIHRWHNISSSDLSTLSTILGLIAAVLWAAQNMSEKVAQNLDSTLSLVTPKTAVLGITSLAAMCLAILELILIFSRVEPFDVITMPLAPLELLGISSNTVLVLTLVMCSTITLAVVIIFRCELFSLINKDRASSKETGNLRRNLDLFATWVVLTVILFFAVPKIWPLLLGTAMVAGLRYLAFSLVRMLVSPITVSEDIRILVEGRSITLAFVFLLCCLALVFFVCGLFLAAPLAHSPR